MPTLQGRWLGEETTVQGPAINGTLHIFSTEGISLLCGKDYLCMNISPSPVPPTPQPNHGCQRNKMLVAALSYYMCLLKGKKSGMLHKFGVKGRQEGREARMQHQQQ